MQIYEGKPFHDTDFSEYLYGEFLLKNNLIPNTISRIHWFHGTRCFPETAFMKKGILPLGMVMHQLFAKIDDIAEKNSIMATDTDDSWCTHYFSLFVLKTENPAHWGPYAMLMKEALLSVEVYDFHNYLDIPEIVEDYIYSKYPLSSDILLEIYRKETRACIVEFWTLPMDRQEDTLETALYYLYSSYHKSDYSMFCNTCYDGNGKPIPADQIISVEYID